MKDLVTYPFGTISNTFNTAMPLALFMYFVPPSRFYLFAFSLLGSFYVLYGRGEENHEERKSFWIPIE
jgi:hypothetical protein